MKYRHGKKAEDTSIFWGLASVAFLVISGAIVVLGFFIAAHVSARY